MSSSEKWPGKGLCGSCFSVWGPPHSQNFVLGCSIKLIGSDSGENQIVEISYSILYSIQNNLITPPLPSHTVHEKYILHIHWYSPNSHRKGAVECWTREKRRGTTGESIQITKLGRNYQHKLMYTRNWLSPVYKLYVCWTGENAVDHILRNKFLGDDDSSVDVCISLL